MPLGNIRIRIEIVVPLRLWVIRYIPARWQGTQFPYNSNHRNLERQLTAIVTDVASTELPRIVPLSTLCLQVDVKVLSGGLI